MKQPKFCNFSPGILSSIPYIISVEALILTHQTSVQEWTQGRLEAWVCWKMLYLGNVFQLIQSHKEHSRMCWGYLFQLSASAKSWQADPKFLDQRQEGVISRQVLVRILTSICKCAVLIADFPYPLLLQKLYTFRLSGDSVSGITVLIWQPSQLSLTSLRITRALSYSSRCSP